MRHGLNNPVKYLDPSGHCSEIYSNPGNSDVPTVTGYNCGENGELLDEFLAEHTTLPSGEDLYKPRNVTREGLIAYYMLKNMATVSDEEWKSSNLSILFEQAVKLADHNISTFGGPNGVAMFGTLMDVAFLGAMEAGRLYTNGRLNSLAFASSYPCHSFSEDTLVATEDGLVPISEIEVGDMVLAYNEVTRETGYYEVTHTWEHLDPEIVYLTINGETIETTPWHPFYTVQGWQNAGELNVGSLVMRSNGSYGFVYDVDVEAQPQLMYDLTVDVAHTFFIGDGKWLVHNCTPIQTGGRKVYGSTGQKLNEELNMDVHRRDWGRALEKIKEVHDFRGDVHGRIMSDGSWEVQIRGQWQTIDYLQHYLP